MAPTAILSLAALHFYSVTFAMPWIGPMATSMGLMATAGVSPRPTQAPAMELVLGDLRSRQNILFPPPLNWCGFVNSLYDRPLSCSAGLTCINSGAVMGCCTATTGLCDGLYTTCANYLDTCDAACQADPGIRKCNVAFPFCGTYEFFGGTRLYNCQHTSMLASAVELLNDYYITAIGSTIGGASTAILDNSGLVFLGSVAASGSSTTVGGSSSSTGTSSSAYYITSGGGLSATAIDGIAAGCSIAGALILGLVVFFCLRRNKRKRMNRAAEGMRNSTYAPVTPMPPIQQQHMQMPPKAFDGYQSVPQQEVQHYPVSTKQQPQQYQQYASPPMTKQQQQPASYFPTAATAQGQISPQSVTHNRASAPPLPSASPLDGTQSYYKPPLSPEVTEVDGTMGNPGIPSPSSTHVRLSEVDGTIGNPGVPVGGPGITLQGVPGGSPRSTEIEGNPVRASLNAPFTDVYEMPHDRS